MSLGLGGAVDVIPTPQTDEETEKALGPSRRPRIIAATYADVLLQHREGTEYKYLAHSGRPVTLRCGLLRRRPVFIERSRAIGKESRLAEEAQAGAVPAEAMDTIYEAAEGRPGTAEREAVLGELRSVLPILRPLPRKWLAKRARVSEKSKILSAILNGRKHPGVALANRLVKIARAVQQVNGDLEQAATLLRRSGAMTRPAPAIEQRHTAQQVAG